MSKDINELDESTIVKDEPPVKVRIISVDKLNWGVQLAKKVEKEDEEPYWIWKTQGYYGEHLGWAINSALKLGYPANQALELDKFLNDLLLSIRNDVKEALGLELIDKKLFSVKHTKIKGRKYIKSKAKNGSSSSPRTIKSKKI